MSPNPDEEDKNAHYNETNNQSWDFLMAQIHSFVKSVGLFLAHVGIFPALQ